MALNYDSGLSGKDIIDMIMGYQRSQIICTASSLGIFEELHSSSTPLTATVLGNRLRTNVDALERLLNTCTALQLLEKETTPQGQAAYSNATATEKFLVKSSPMSFRPLANSVSYMYPMWGHFKECIKEGHNRTTAAPQTAKKDAKPENGNKMFTNNAVQLDFLQAMHMFSKMDAPLVIKAFDLNEFDSACDLGGGSGALGLQLAKCYPDMQVTVYDLPHVVNLSPHFLPQPAPRNLKFEPGDFFQQPLPSADLYVLSHVIHDWSEDKINLLLRKIYQSLTPGGAVLILEKTLTESKDAPLMTSMFDLGMLVVSEGRERTPSEYQNLLEEAGFEEIDIKIVPQSSFRDAILARKVLSH